LLNRADASPAIALRRIPDSLVATIDPAGVHFMTSIPEGDARSPLLSVLFKPREAIERIVATQPRRHVLLLANLGTISAIAAQMVDSGAGDSLLNWRILLPLVVGGSVLGIVFLYVGALLFNWIGRLLGARVSPLELRAVFAWSTTPSILGNIVAVALLVALPGAPVRTDLRHC
jgi:hypothetical protein